ncbi:MAG: hypothetical protein IH948_00980 [Bacteroidetes bacterium]|nr:hypothetical protein [Bacteroidota bacterium]
MMSLIIFSKVNSPKAHKNNEPTRFIPVKYAVKRYTETALSMPVRISDHMNLYKMKGAIKKAPSIAQSGKLGNRVFKAGIPITPKTAIIIPIPMENAIPIP